MIFKIILSILLASTVMNVFVIDKPRENLTAGVVVIQIIFNAIIIYGVWNWI